MVMLADTQVPTARNEDHGPENAATQDPLEAAPMVQRIGAHRDRIYMAVLELESEKFELQARRDHVRQQFEAVERGLALHIQDIEATLALYEAGVNSLPAPGKSRPE